MTYSKLFFRTILGFTALASALPACGGKVVVDATGSATTGSSSTGSNPDACPPSTPGIFLEGTIDGAKNSLLTPFDDFSANAQSTTFTMVFGSGGRLHFSGQEDFGVETPAASTGAWLRPPTAMASSGIWFCDAAPGLVSFDKPIPGLISASATLSTLRKLGACPGNPIYGALSVCLAIDDPSCSVLSGTLGGNPFKAATTQGINFPGGYLWSLADGGLMDLESDKGTGTLITPAGGADGGAVYCIGTIETTGDHAFELTGFSRLGTCAEAGAAAGSIAMCASY